MFQLRPILTVHAVLYLIRAPPIYKRTREDATDYYQWIINAIVLISHLDKAVSL